MRAFIFREAACFFESRQDGALKQEIQKEVSISLTFIVKVIQKQVCKSTKTYFIFSRTRPRKFLVYPVNEGDGQHSQGYPELPKPSKSDTGEHTG